MSRPSRSALLPPLTMDGRPRRATLYRLLRDNIIDGLLAPGERLPSSRAVAAEYGLARGTVEEVFDQLVGEELIVRTVGRGTFVGPGTKPGRSASAPIVTLKPSFRGTRLLQARSVREPAVVLPFNAGVPDPRLFPVQAWAACRRRAIAELEPDAWNHCEAEGYPPLREQLARYLAQFRGVRADPSQVLVFSSTAQALTTLFLLLCDPGERVAIEDPGYPVARSAARVAGLEVQPVPLDADGLQVEALRRASSPARLAYVTPAHQYPTGVRLSRRRREELLAWAAAANGLILEDDYDADFRYHGEPLTTLYAAGEGRVIYLGTLSKAMFLGLRVAYAVVPKELAASAADVRAQFDGFPPLETQATLARFIAEGRLAAHVRVMRRAYAEKLKRMIEALAPTLERGWTAGPHAAGLHFVLYEPAPGAAKAVAETSGLALSRLSDYSLVAPSRDGLCLRFGGLDRVAIDMGAARLNSAAQAV